MKLTFTFTDSLDLESLSRDDIYNTYFEIPDEALYLIGLQERVLGVAELVGRLTQAALHVSCKELEILKNPIKLDARRQSQISLSYQSHIIVLHFTRQNRRRAQSRQLKILLPVPPPVSAHYWTSRGKRKRERTSLSLNLFRGQLDKWKSNSTDEQEYMQTIFKLSENLLVLLNAEPVQSHVSHWQYVGFHPYWHDGKLILQHNRRFKRFAAEQRKQERLEAKRQRQDSRVAELRENAPLPSTGAGRRPGAVPGVFKGVQFRSQLEIRFATEIESRGIRWVYETERLGDGNYLVDFYLPDLKSWVEVKGRFEPRDDYLLKDVAAYLKNERQERLFVYTQSKCYAIYPSRFTEIERNIFWDRLLNIR